MNVSLPLLVITTTFVVSVLIFNHFTSIQECDRINSRILDNLRHQASPVGEMHTFSASDDYITEKHKVMQRMALTESAANRANLVKLARGTDHKAFYEAVKVEAYCPIMPRVGGSDDGGKFVCNPTRSKSNCTHLSLGLNNQIDYDIAIQVMTDRQKCKILGVDANVQNPGTQRIYESIRGTTFIGMVPKDITIAQMMEKAGAKEVDLMKIDIEGGEHTGLEPFLKEYHVCQIFLEIHGTPTEHLTMMKTISRLGFRLFSVEPNIYCDTCCEYSYINELCMHRFGAIPLANNVPLD